MDYMTEKPTSFRLDIMEFQDTSREPWLRSGQLNLQGCGRSSLP